jgi:hypothetical protein
MVTPLEKDDRASDWTEDDEPKRADDDLDDFFFDEEEPGPGDRRRDPLRKP